MAAKNATVSLVKRPSRQRCLQLPLVMTVASLFFAGGCTDDDVMSPQQDAAETLDSSVIAASDSRQAPMVDAASLDATSADAVTSADALVCVPTPSKVECSPEFQHNENTVGLFVAPGSPIGWKFEVKGDCPRTLTRLGLNIRNGNEVEGSVFGSIVALKKDDSRPLDPAKSPASVLKTVLLPLAPYSSGSKTVSAEVSITLVPGWYEVVFGVSALGATSTSATVHSGNTQSCSNHTHPFTIKTQNDTIILQGVGPHLFVEMN